MSVALVIMVVVFGSVGAQPVVRAPAVAPVKPPARAPALPPTARGFPLPIAPAPGPSLEDLFPPCQGVLAVYESTFTKKIYPFLNDTPWLQPYKFQATATLTNMGYSTVENWEMGILYQHDEVSLSPV